MSCYPYKGEFELSHIKKQHGFTLIELILVIVILGILAATAAPKFIDISSDASKSVLQGVKGALRSGIQMARGKAIIDGVNLEATLFGSALSINVNGQDVFLHLGYVAPYAVNINKVIEIDATTARPSTNTDINTDFLILSNASLTHVYIYPSDKIGSATDAAPDGGQQCYVLYHLEDRTPSVTTVTSGC